MSVKKGLNDAEAVEAMERFTKEQLLSAKCLRNQRDLVEALLKDGVLYSLEGVEQIIDSYRKGKVKKC